MLLNMYLALATFMIHFTSSFCFRGYEQFPGFGDGYDTIRYGVNPPFANTTHRENVAATRHHSPLFWLKSSTATSDTVTKVKPTTPSVFTRPLVLPIIYPKFNCSEDELPFNIGTYEVPTQRDLVLQIQRTLRRMFSLYQEKALDLLQDIHQATKATTDIEKKCLSFNQHNYRKNYKKCVKQVSMKCEFITKSLVTSLERQRADVSAFIEGTICNVTEMRADPVQLIKTLAMEQASLEFALPGFLRLLGSCSAYCDKTHPIMKHKKPLRHMTDQDLVVKHFLTKKSYAQLIN